MDRTIAYGEESAACIAMVTNTISNIGTVLSVEIECGFAIAETIICEAINVLDKNHGFLFEETLADMVGCINRQFFMIPNMWPIVVPVIRNICLRLHLDGSYFPLVFGRNISTGYLLRKVI